MARTPPRIPSGQIPSADTFNALRDWVLELMTIRVGPGLQMTRATGGTFISLMHNPQNQISGQAEPPGPTPSSSPMFPAQITSYEVCGPNQWSYGFAEVRHPVGAGHIAPWTQKADGITGTAHNLIEHMNNGVGVEGNGIDVTAMAEEFPGFAYMPCPVGNIVIIHIYRNPVTQGSGFWFEYCNSVDGGCE